MTQSEFAVTRQIRPPLMEHILGALAEFELSLIVERTQAGLIAAKQCGANLGRKPSLSDDQRQHERELLDGRKPVDCCQTA